MNQGMLAGKAAIVTGAGQGIGFAIAKRLATEGASVLINDLEPELASHAAAMIQSEGGRCEALAGDASDYDLITRLTERCLSLFSRLDITVANAGITHFGDFFSFTPAAMRKVLGLNIEGSFFLTQKSATIMREQGEGGSILLVSSVVGIQAHRNLAAYAMSKAALQMLARNLVAELSPHHININAIAPGATLTERTIGTDPAYEEIWSALTPLGRPSTAEDIASAAAFLLSPQARQITGQTLVVDGGWTSVSPVPGEDHFKKVDSEH